MKNLVLYCICFCIPFLAFARENNINPETGNPVFLPVPNDDCSTAYTLSIPESYSATTLGALTGFPVACTDPGGGGTGGNGNYDVWFSFIGTGTELEISVCNSNTNFDTKMAIYEGSGCFSMTCVAANDDYALDLDCYMGGSARKSKIYLTTVLSSRYFVRLDGFGLADFGDYTIDIAELVPAPVTLVDFWGEPWERGNTIAWETSSEENVMWHIIERSPNGRDNWSEVGKLVSSSTNTQGAIYEMIDNAPFTDTYYRLRTVDYDGSEQYSNIISILREKPDFEVTKVFPNPVMEEVSFQIDSDRSELMRLRVVDLSGKTVISDEVEIRDGLNEFSMNAEAWKAGIYFVQFRSRQGYVTRKIVKQD